LVGSTEPYVTSTTVTSASGPTTTSEAINFIEVGVKLFVTPTIHKDDFITMKIRPEVSSVVNTVQTSSNNAIPVVGTTEAETTVLLKDGTMIIIGGLIEEERHSTVNKIPVLGSIPYLGYLFKNETESTTKQEIAIFLKASIMTGDVHEDVKAATLKLGAQEGKGFDGLKGNQKD
jgi:general secretion pathway protein D